jgi:hypothetical protein
MGKGWKICRPIKRNRDNEYDRFSAGISAWYSGLKEEGPFSATKEH